MALMQNTEQLFGVSKEEKNGEEESRERTHLPDIHAGDGLGPKTILTHVEGKEGKEGDHEIVTPGPRPKTTKSDDEFIAPEGTPAPDPSYQPTDEDTEGTDADEEDERTEERYESGTSMETWSAKVQARTVVAIPLR